MILDNQAKWKDNGKLKLLIIVGTRPEIIRLAAVIKKNAVGILIPFLRIPDRTTITILTAFSFMTSSSTIRRFI